MVESRALNLLFPHDAANVRRRDRVLAVVCAMLALVLVLRAARKDGGVLVQNQAFGARFLAREDPYFDADRGAFVHRPYPPSYAWITAPLALLPTTLARVAWASAQIAALYCMYRVLRRFTAEHWPELSAHAPVVFAIALLLASRYLLRDMAGGGGNTLYAASALCAVDGSLRHRHLRAGLALALPLVLKPTLAPLALFFVRRGRRRTLAWTAVFAATLFCAPAIWYGAARYADLARRWTADVVSTAQLTEREAAAMPDLADSMNQSLRGAVARLAGGAAQEPAGGGGALALAIGLVLAAATCAAAWRAPIGRAEVLAALAFFPLALLASPISWKAHHVALLPALYALTCEALGPPRRRALVAFLVAYYLVCDLASEELVGKAAKATLDRASVVGWSDVLLLAALVFASRRAARASG